jgi:butyryl-CoA dehydrogenase
LKLLALRMNDSITRAGQCTGLAEPAQQLASALQRVGAATKAAWATGVPEEALANATPYLQAFGHLVLAWMWLEIGLAVQARQGSAFAQGKLAAMHYFYGYELAKIDAWLQPVASRNPLTREMRDEWF